MKKTFTTLFVFCGIGLGAKGFLNASVELEGIDHRFESLGGIDNDPDACADFEYLTKSRALCADVKRLTPGELRDFAGVVPPDAVFLSPPCKGASALLSKAKAATPKYQEMNRLALDWLELMLSTWDVPPRLVLLENVPRLPTRAKETVDEAKRLLTGAGYLINEQTHDCGVIGGLAQHRLRYLMMARQADRCPPLLYLPPPQRVRACGEVLGPLPLPEDPAGGPMHRLPRITWRNWVRLALIPAGGDYRDLEGVLRDGQPRREVHRRHRVEQWDEPCGTIAGSGSNGVQNIADPRFGNVDKVTPWTEPVQTITSSPAPSSGAAAVADPRVTLRVAPAYDHAYGVLRWDEPSSTIAGGSDVGQGAYSVADVRFDAADIRFRGTYYGGAYGVLSWQEAAGTITGKNSIDGGRFAVADPRKPPPELRIIISADGTWHRPLTILEKGVLQGLPTHVDGKPVKLAGDATGGWSERIGNAVPEQAARAIAEQALICLGQGAAGTWSLSGGGSVWVERAGQRLAVTQIAQVGA